MATLKGSLAIALCLPILSVLGLGCSPVRVGPGPVEKPAEILLPPTLSPGGIDRIRSDLKAYANGDPHTHTRPATCKGCVVDTEIQSIGLTTDITPLNGPAKFRVIGRVVNKDPYDTEEKYSLKPGTEYLMWVAPAPLNKAGTSRTRWGFLELPAGSTGSIKPVTIGYVLRCNYPNPPGVWKSDADFKNCDDAHPVRRTTSTGPGPAAPSSIWSHPRSQFSVVPGDGWFDCGGYCCTGTTETQ